MGSDTPVGVEEGGFESRLHVRIIIGRIEPSIVIQPDYGFYEIAVLCVDIISNLVVEKIQRALIDGRGYDIIVKIQAPDNLIAAFIDQIHRTGIW